MIDQLLRATPSPSPDPSSEEPKLSDWLERLAQSPFEASIDRAFWAGFEADRLGYAFVGGYHAALMRLLGGRPGRRSLAATEKGGAHPKAIETKLTRASDGQFRLNGEKTFATLASVASEILVVASTGSDAEGKNRLKLVRIARDTAGLTIEDRAPTPFAPEIPHSRLTFKDVIVDEGAVLSGDGYDVYLKPFRTFEDTHVLAAAIGHVLRTARMHAFDHLMIESLIVFALATQSIAAMDPRSSSTHLALAGVFGGLRKLITDNDSEWQTKADKDTRDRWHRDIGLLAVAETVRQKRTEAAWDAIRTDLT